MSCSKPFCLNSPLGTLRLLLTMRLTQLAATVGFAATLVRGYGDDTWVIRDSNCHVKDVDNPETDVTFFKYQAHDCKGEDGSGGHTIEHGKLETPTD